MAHHRLIDLFSGAGGMTLGFCDDRFCGGFESVWALDNDQAAVATHRANFGPHADCYDIEKWLEEDREIPSADVVIGGPPCQGFSLLNKKRKDDPRRSLWLPFLEVVERSSAKAFVIENVTGLFRSPELIEIEAKADELGFDLVGGVLLAADYGVAQARKRTVLVGYKRTLGRSPQFPPLKTHASPNSDGNLPNWLTVRDAISDLPDPVGREIRATEAPLNLHFGRNPTQISQRRYRAVPVGGNRFDLQKNAPEITPKCWIRKKSGGTDLFGRLWWDRPSVTIRTEFYKPEKGRYLHPEKDRPITHREAARLMGFPDDFRFEGTKIEVARQIGNAVPPPLAGSIAQTVSELITVAIQKKAA